MDTLLWRIDKKDISWESGQMCPFIGGRIGAGSQASLARFSTLYAPLVQYRERHFAAKAISIGQLDTQMKHQLKLVSYAKITVTCKSINNVGNKCIK